MSRGLLTFAPASADWRGETGWAIHRKRETALGMQGIALGASLGPLPSPIVRISSGRAAQVSHPRPLQHLQDRQLDTCSSSSTKLHHLMAAVPPVSFLQLCIGCQLILRRSHGKFAACIRKRGTNFRDVFRRRRDHQPSRAPRITHPCLQSFYGVGLSTAINHVDVLGGMQVQYWCVAALIILPALTALPPKSRHASTE